MTCFHLHEKFSHIRKSTRVLSPDWCTFHTLNPCILILHTLVLFWLCHMNFGKMKGVVQSFLRELVLYIPPLYMHTISISWYDDLIYLFKISNFIHHTHKMLVCIKLLPSQNKKQQKIATRYVKEIGFSLDNLNKFKCVNKLIIYSFRHVLTKE